MPRKPKSKPRREPAPMDEGARIIESAEKAGADYAHEQVGSPHFNDWVIDQMVEAERMRNADPNSVVPLETPADAKRVAKSMLKQLEWDTKKQMDLRDILELVDGATGVFSLGSASWVRDTYGITEKEVADSFFGGFVETLESSSTREWLTEEILTKSEELRGVGVREAAREASTGSRPYFGEADHWGYAIQIDGIENSFPQLPIGRQIDGNNAVKQFKATAKHEWISTKRRKGQRPLAEIKRWIKAVQPSQFYARWRTDVDDDSTEIWYTGGQHGETPQSAGAREMRRSRGPSPRRTSVVRDYVAVDTRGRTIAGPFTDYSDAKREANKARGYVKFATERRSGRR
jgi:hypothetical protein